MSTEPSISRDRVFRFGPFELSERQAELRKSGVRIKLQEQPFRVLVELVANSGNLVSREDLHKKLWPADTFVDFDHGLNTAVNQLRNALGDSAANPRFIETLPRRGYRFIAPVEVHSPQANAMVTDQEPRAVPQPQSQNHSATETAAVKSDSQGEGPSAETRARILSDPKDLPNVSRNLVRLLFSLIQLMYLSFYVISLARLSQVGELLTETGNHASLILVALVVTAAAGIPVRLFLISAAAFDYKGLNAKFQRLFPFIFPLDELWSLAPFLIVEQVGLGVALAMTAALVYLPFAQRSLLHMGFSARRETA